jgi:hypothetical protein
MRQFTWISLLALAFSLGSAPSFADEKPKEAQTKDTKEAQAKDANKTRTIDANVSKIYLGGVATLQLHQGPTPSLVVVGDEDTSKQITTVQSGDTLRIETTHGFFLHVPSIHIELTLPKLTNFTSSGVGSAQITGFSGDDLQLTITGTGDVTVNANYKRVVARSSGVASLTLNDLDSDSIDVSLPGAGHVTLIGQTKTLMSHINGVGSLDAKDLKADAVTTYLNGVGSAKVFAKESANMYLHGVGSAMVYGNPTVRKAEVSGFGKVTWEQ